MIRLTRLNGQDMYLNAELVAMVEAHHDTVVTLTDGRCYVVEQTAEQIVASVVRYRAQVLALAERYRTEPPVLDVDELPDGDAQILPLRAHRDGR